MKKHDEIEREFLKAYDEYADSFFRHGLYKLSDREKALDLVHDAFAKTWEYMVSGKEIERIPAFIYRTLNNLIIDEYRRKKTSSLDVLAEAGFDPVEKNSVSEMLFSAESQIVIAAMDELPQRFREVMRLRYVDGLSIKEIALMLDEHENNVSVRLTRATSRLREILNISHG